MTKILIFILAVAFAGTASAITFNSTKIGPAKVYTAPSGVGTVYTSTPLTEYAIQGLSAFRGNFNPINLAGTVGAVIAVQAISDGLNSLRAQVGVNNRNYPAPDGWSNSQSPPSTTGTIQGFILSGTTYSSLAAACQGEMVRLQQSGQGTIVSNTAVAPNRCYYYNSSGSQLGNSTVLVDTVCPPGYASNTGICNLVDVTAVKWVSDSVPTYYQKPDGTFVYHPNDPDTTSQPAYPSFRIGTDQYNNPVSESLSPNAVGGIDYKRREESVNQVNGQPITYETILTTNDFGVVTGVYSNTYNSTLSNVSSSNSVTNNNQTVDVSMLNKETTQQEIKQLLNPQTMPDLTNLGDAEIGKYNDAISEANSSNTDLNNNPASQLNLPQYWTFASGTCFPAEFSAGRFGIISFASFCQIYDDHIRSLIVFMLAVWSVLHIFSYWSEVVKEI